MACNEEASPMAVAGTGFENGPFQAESCYRVCRKIAVRHHNLPRLDDDDDDPPIRIIPPEVVYVPCSLKEAAAAVDIFI